MKSAARRHIAVLAVKMVILFPICPTSPEVTTWFMLTSIQLTFLRLALTKIKSDFTHSFPFHLKAAMFLLFLPLVGFLPLTSSPIPITTSVHLHVKEVHVYLCATNFTALNHFPAPLQTAAWVPVQWHRLYSHFLCCCIHKYEKK